MNKYFYSICITSKIWFYLKDNNKALVSFIKYFHLCVGKVFGSVHQNVVLECFQISCVSEVDVAW